MASLRRRSRSIPSADVAALRRPWLRTGLVRVSLVGLVCALVAAALVTARGLEPRSSELTPGGRSGVVVIDVSLSIVTRDYARVRGILERVIRAGNPMGLVMFSDAAYELLPPRTPAKELESLLRFFTPTEDGLPENPWTPSFQAGTRISTALALAQDMLERDGVSPASILLVSDLETAPSDFTPLGKTLARIRKSSTTVRVVPLSSSSDAITFFGGLLGPETFVDPVEPNAGETRPLDVSLRGESPFWLLLAAGLVLIVLAAHERFAGRLALPDRRGLEAGVRRHALTGGAVLACLVAGVALLLLALDVSRARASFAADDVRYRSAPDSTLWQPAELLPSGVARRLLDVDDDIRFRRALRGVLLSHPETPGFSDPAYVVNRNEATAWLTDVVQGDDDLSRRSAAANLLGVLSFADAIADYDNRGKLLTSAGGRFRQAIAFDPTNEDAKFNLELTLSRSQGLEPHRVRWRDRPVPGRQGLARRRGGRSGKWVLASAS